MQGFRNRWVAGAASPPALVEGGKGARIPFLFQMRERFKVHCNVM